MQRRTNYGQVLRGIMHTRTFRLVSGSKSKTQEMTRLQRLTSRSLRGPQQHANRCDIQPMTLCTVSRPL